MVAISSSWEGRSHAAGVVVGQGHHDRVAPQGVLHDPPQVQPHPATSPLRHLPAADHPALGVQAELVDHLLGLGHELLQEKGPDPLGGVQDLLVGGGGDPGPAGHLGHQLDEGGGPRGPSPGTSSSSSRGAASTASRFPNRSIRAWAMGFTSPAGDGVVQQQLQHLVVGEGVDAVLPELPPLPLPMPRRESPWRSPPSSPPTDGAKILFCYCITLPSASTR